MQRVNGRLRLLFDTFDRCFLTLLDSDNNLTNHLDHIHLVTVVSANLQSELFLCEFVIRIALNADSGVCTFPFWAIQVLCKEGVRFP